MKVLLVYPATPETSWSFKHVLRFVSKRAAFRDIDHLVLGEAEQLMPQLVEDMCCGTRRHMHTASSRPGITRVLSSPWDLSLTAILRKHVAQTAQTGRGWRTEV